MRTIALLVILALAPSCATVTPIAKDCGAQTVANLINDVNTALATADYAGQLAKLVGSFGGCAIKKAVEEVAKKAGMRAQFDELEALKVKRANDWLEANADSGSQ